MDILLGFVKVGILKFSFEDWIYTFNQIKIKVLNIFLGSFSIMQIEFSKPEGEDLTLKLCEIPTQNSTCKLTYT